MSQKKRPPAEKGERLALQPSANPAKTRKGTKAARARVIPRRWLNAVFGVFLLPVAFVVTQTFFADFSRTTAEREWYATDEFWFFGLGAALWTLWFFGSIWSMGEPRPLRAYVFGHELTHAIWVWMWGGRVSEFEVSRKGGYILTDTHNFWIALAPYFYPLYSLVIIVVYGLSGLFYNVATVSDTMLLMTPLQWLFLLLGASWAFHLSFTIWMIPKGQTDLTYHGTFFSLVVIYLMNLLILAVFLIVASPQVSFASFGKDLLGNVEDWSELIWTGMGRVLRGG